MLSISSKNTKNTRQLITNTYDEAQSWIGRRLILRRPLLEHMPGTPCIVMCVVDFGDGPLLWIVTDDKQAIEVDQFELSRVSYYFQQRKPEAASRTA